MRYTEAMEGWIRQNYRKGTINDNLDAFEAEFGIRPSKQALYVKAHKMGLRKDAHSNERYVPAVKRMRWSAKEFEREREWMLANDTGESVFTTIDAFEREFGFRLNRSQVSLFRSTYGTSKRVSHGGGKPALPIGTERPGKDGYIKVKVREFPTVPQSKDNWRFKHHLAWEEANGRKLPDGWTVLFADHDKDNYDPGNLVAVPRNWIGVLNNPELPAYSDRETLEACIALAKLNSSLRDATHLSERKCRVCGTPFTPTEAQRSYRTPVMTCPECRAAGKRWAGERKPAGEGVCVVCGKAFPKRIPSQRRCSECVAEKPKASPDRHAERARSRS